MKIEKLEIQTYDAIDIGLIQVKVKGVQDAQELFTHIVNYINQSKENQTATDGKENQ
jgi:hypothetical protein